jgi:hypothetical protein
MERREDREILKRMFLFYQREREKVRRVPRLTSEKFISFHAMNMATMQHSVPTRRGQRRRRRRNK